MFAGDGWLFRPLRAPTGSAPGRSVFSSARDTRVTGISKPATGQPALCDLMHGGGVSRLGARCEFLSVRSRRTTRSPDIHCKRSRARSHVGAVLTKLREMVFVESLPGHGMASLLPGQFDRSRHHLRARTNCCSVTCVPHVLPTCSSTNWKPAASYNRRAASSPANVQR